MAFTSNRVLHHPSLMALCSYGSCLRENGNRINTIHPSEMYYVDPTRPAGTRIPNYLTCIRAFDGSHLNTPQPIMSSRVASNNLDPYRIGPHPVLHFGGIAWTVHPLPPQFILQPAPGSDEAVINLMKQYHQRAMRSNLSSSPAWSAPLWWSSAVVGADGSFYLNPQCERGSQRGRVWSEAELEAAGVLLTVFHQENEELLGVAHPDIGSPGGCGESESRRSCGAETLGPSQSGGLEVRRSEELTDLEREAMQGLLDLSEMVTFNWK